MDEPLGPNDQPRQGLEDDSRRRRQARVEPAPPAERLPAREESEYDGGDDHALVPPHQRA